MSKKYKKKALVKVELWVSHRAAVLGPSTIYGDRDWRSAVRYSNGHMEWQWHKTYEEAVDWCESFLKPNNMLTGNGGREKTDGQ